MTKSEARRIVAEMVNHDLQSESIDEGGPIRLRNGDIDALRTVRGWNEASTNAGDRRTTRALELLGERESATHYERLAERWERESKHDVPRPEALTRAQIRDLKALSTAIEAKAVRTGLTLSHLGLVRVVYVDGQRRYSLTTRGFNEAQRRG